MNDSITGNLKAHYENVFRQFGATVKGVDWGDDEEKLTHRYDTMLAVMTENGPQKPSILDVGCGFGGLYMHMRDRGINARYTGLDIGDEMISWARANIGGDAEFIHADILDWDAGGRHFDYVICNGILTQKLDASNIEMESYASRIVRRLYDLAETGVAFNLMTTKVNFFSNNLFYKNPSEMLAWCMSELTPYVRIDHSYYGFDYTVYLYRNPTFAPQ